MGNLVTPQNWEHFWLNEGFTMFIERKIIQHMHSKAEADFSAIIGLKALQESVDLYKKSGKLELTKLVLNLEGVDPDDAFSSVPYEKGFNFLAYIETQLGGSVVFEPFLKAYVKKFSGKSIITDDFVEYLFHYFENDNEKTIALKSIDWKLWLHGEGIY